MNWEEKEARKRIKNSMENLYRAYLSLHEARGIEKAPWTKNQLVRKLYALVRNCTADGIVQQATGDGLLIMYVLPSSYHHRNPKSEYNPLMISIYFEAV